MRLQSSIAGKTVYAEVPDGSYASSSCATGYNQAYIWDETGRWQVHVCVPAPAPPPPVYQPPPPPVYNNYNTVSPQVTVSPQISPVFQQQFQPQNSPAVAATTQQTQTPAPAPAPAPAPVSTTPRIVEMSAPPPQNNTPESVQPIEQNNTPAPAPYVPVYRPPVQNNQLTDTEKVLQAATGQAVTATPAATSNKTMLYAAGAAIALLLLLSTNKKRK